MQNKLCRKESAAIMAQLSKPALLEFFHHLITTDECTIMTNERRAKGVAVIREADNESFGDGSDVVLKAYARMGQIVAGKYCRSLG